MASAADELFDDFVAYARAAFHFVEAPTRRENQQYKRFYHSWKLHEAAPGRDMEIMATTVGADEWQARLRPISARLLALVRAAVAAETEAHVRAADDRIAAAGAGAADPKVFEDTVFDEDPQRFSLVDLSDPAQRVPGAAMKLSWWKPGGVPATHVFDADGKVKTAPASRPNTTDEQKMRAARLLVDRRRTADLLFLARQPGGLDTRWFSGALDVARDALQVWICAGVAVAFPRVLDAEDRAHWLPCVRDGNLHWAYKSDFVRLLEAVGGEKDRARRPALLRRHALHALEALAVAETFKTACGDESWSAGWEAFVVRQVKGFVGFGPWEPSMGGYRYSYTWGRWYDAPLSRPGQGTKQGPAADDGERATFEEEVAALEGSARRAPKKVDILHMGGGNRPLVEEEEDEEEDENSKKLGRLEREEALYGTRRSFKYQRKRGRGA